MTTNLIGNLDKAAIREGRFDKKIGIYPPDLLSRLGRLQHELVKNRKNIKDIEDKIAEVVIKSGGLSMVQLGKPDWFTYKKYKDEGTREERILEEGTPMDYLINDGNKINCPEPEAKFSMKDYTGTENTEVEKECAEWNLVNEADNEAKELENNKYNGIINIIEKKFKKEGN